MILKRMRADVTGIYSTLTDDAGKFICVTLEHAFQNSDGNYHAIVADGAYTCTRRISPKFGFSVFQVMNVPGHTYVEIHIGNFNCDSSGCILLGEQMVDDMITNSKQTFENFMECMNGVDTFTLTVSS